MNEQQQNRASEMIQSDRETGRVLVVDDEDYNRLLLRDLLAEQGHEVAEAADGVQALSAVAGHPPDIVLLDVMMPGMDGFEVCKRLKQEPQSAHIPVLMVTALRDREDRLQGIRAGADDFLSKPIDVQEVLLRVRNGIYAKQLFDENLSFRRELEQKVEAQTHQLREAYEQLELQVRELDGRDRLVHFQMSGPTLDEAYGEVLQVVTQVMEMKWGVLLRPEAQQLRAVAALGFTASGHLESRERVAQIPLIATDGNQLSARALDRRQVQYIDREAAVPMMYRDEIIGVLQVGGAAIDKDAPNALWRLGREAALVLRMAGVAAELTTGTVAIDELLEMDI